MFTVRPATSADRPEVLALLREMIPGVDAEARWRWLYEANPAGRALTWLAVAQGQVAGCTSMFPLRLWLDGEVVRGALGGDGFVRPAFRRRGVGGFLHEASRSAMAGHGLGCMYGAPGAMNLTPLKHGGARELGHVARWVRPIRAAALGLGSLRLASLRLATSSSRAALEPMRPGDPRVDGVWAEARGQLRLAAVRDAVFHTWRFLEAPSGQQPAYVIVADGRPIGTCVLQAMAGGAAVRIVDLVTVPGAWHRGLRAIVRHVAYHGTADQLTIKLFAPDGRRRQMWRSGFAERDGKPFLCMIPTGGDRRFLDPDRWYYSCADSDLDLLT